jgi:hypothetical protein
MKLPEQHAHIVDYERLQRESFMLLNLAYGSFSLRNENREDVICRSDAHIFTSFGDLYSLEVSTLLTSVCISARILDDIIRKNGKGTLAKAWKYEDMLGDDEEGDPLSLRDCFNKTIHAESIDHELMQLPEVYLYGRSYKKGWHVRIFLLPFCVSVFQWVEENRIAQQDVSTPTKESAEGGSI